MDTLLRWAKPKSAGPPKPSAEDARERRDGVCERLGLPWPQPKPKAGAGRPSFQKRFEAELYKAIRNNEWE
eukprot:2635299-Amphidinium_carterae.1